MAFIVIMVFQTTGMENHVGSNSTSAASGITLSIDFNNGTVLDFSGLNGTNVLNVTRSVIDVETQWSGYYAFVVAIGGVSQDQNHWWQYWVNGEYAPVASNMYNLANGDYIEWKRTSSRYTDLETQQLDYSLIIGVAITLIAGVGFLLILSRRTLRREAVL